MTETSDEAEKELEEERMRSIVRGALRGEGEAPDVLAGFQKKMRERSHGKFYADGWSTARHAPVNTYFVTSLLMVLALGVIYALLSPLSGQSERVQNRAAPVNVVSPAPK
jgi:hypothetical protein